MLESSNAKAGHLGKALNDSPRSPPHRSLEADPATACRPELIAEPGTWLQERKDRVWVGGTSGGSEEGKGDQKQGLRLVRM